MRVLVPLALAVLLAWGAYLLQSEWRRFKSDRAPGPLPTPEEVALDRWSAGVVMLVAGLSVVGAVLAFWASSEFSAASGLNQQALQEVTKYQAIKAEQDSYLDFGARLSQALGEHTIAESNLYSEAASAWEANDPVEARALEARARVEGAQERALSPNFLCYWASLGPDGSVTYNEAALQAGEAEAPCVQPGQDPSALRTLGDAQAGALEDSAANDRTTAQEVVLSGVCVILSVFFLTLSYLGRRHRRLSSLGAGTVAIGAALAVSVVAALA